MTLETFFKKFDQFADAADAIESIRRVVLQLAVSGKLVGQLQTDAPVDLELLAKQAAPRKQAEGRSGASLEAVTKDEMIAEIPDSWAWVRLFRLCKPDAPIVYGILQPGPDVRPNGVPYVRPTEIKDGRIRLSEIRHTSPEIAAQYTRATIRKGDVLLTIVGTLGATAVVPEELDGGNITQSSCRLRPESRCIDTSYLLICLRSQTLLSQYRGFSLGSAVQRLNIAHVRALAVPLPPLAEQKRIVAKVDELMALCDRLEAQQQEREEKHTALARASLARFADAPTPANLNFLFHKSYTISPADLRKTILTLAVRGLLVPHEATPTEWETRKLKDLTTKIGSGSTPPGGKESYQESGVPLIRSMNVHFAGFVRHGLAFLNEEQAEKLTNVTVKAHDVLLNITGASIGRVTIAPEDMEGARVNQHVCIVRPTAEILPAFLQLFLASPVVQNLIDDVQVGATREALTKAMIEQFEVPLPPLAQQRSIVAKVDQLLALVDQMHTQLTAVATTSVKLMEALTAELTA